MPWSLLNKKNLCCSDCHKGNPDDKNWKTAHDGLVKDPSYPAEGVCLDCHDIDAGSYKNSMHYHTRPLVDLVLKRAGTSPEKRKHIEKAAETHCGSCHASCGQCHVSRPAYAGGGDFSQRTSSLKDRPCRRSVSRATGAG
ncbi:MAG: hypothetical protein JRJ85_12980 [Deltaproteobacteria bacterium]|nr:hypothetical protein [Deltaproteobacteria bacterium]